MKITNIQWDTDGDKEILATLPTEVEVDEDNLDIDVDEDDENYEEALSDTVSDYLSDTYGFCHFGFNIKDKIIENDTGWLRNVVEWAVAKEGCKVLQAKDNAIIIRNTLLDQDFEITINPIVG